LFSTGDFDGKRQFKRRAVSLKRGIGPIPLIFGFENFTLEKHFGA
jgi:hypothetical protein